MLRLITCLTYIILQAFYMMPVWADKNPGETTCIITVPSIAVINGIGISTYNQTHGIPTGNSVDFSMLVEGSNEGAYWQLTSSIPIGVSITYNTQGNIMAVFISMSRVSDGYTIPPSDISIYPSKAIFDTGPNTGGDTNRIFHFNPIIKVSKKTPPGTYVGTISFTIVGQ